MAQPRRYPLAPLAAAMGLSVHKAGQTLKIAGSTLQDYRERGVTEPVAERLTAKAGLFVYDVWPEILDHAIRDTSPGTRWKREKYANDPDFRAAMIERRRAYYAENGEYEKKRQRLWYAANAAAQRDRSRKVRAAKSPVKDLVYVCECCDIRFPPKRVVQRWCSPDCRTRYRNAHERPAQLAAARLVATHDLPDARLAALLSEATHGIVPDDTIPDADDDKECA